MYWTQSNETNGTGNVRLWQQENPKKNLFLLYSSYFDSRDKLPHDKNEATLSPILRLRERGKTRIADILQNKPLLGRPWEY